MPSTNLRKISEGFKLLSLSQHEAARLQIERACALMLREKDYVCAITLACASDGIIGEHMAKVGQDPFVTTLKKVIKEKYLPEISEKELNDQHINGVRNFLKHCRGDLDEKVELPLEQEAINALLRCICNYAAVFESVPEPMAEFLTWLKTNHPQLLKAADAIDLRGSFKPSEPKNLADSDIKPRPSPLPQSPPHTP